MLTKSAGAPDPIVERLRTLLRESPDLKDLAGVYGAILPLLRDADLHAVAPSLTGDQARAKMEKGVPLLHDLELEFDAEAVYGLMLRLARTVEITGSKKLRLPWLRAFHGTDAATFGERQQIMGGALLRTEAAHRIRLALEENRLDLTTLILHIAAGERGPVASAAWGMQLDPDLLWTLAQNTLKPALRTWCRQLTPLAEGFPWHSGNCFVCGAPATIGELRDNNQVKYLRCGQCGADWPFRRLQCMFCGNEDHATLRCLYPEGRHEKMRLEVCDRCRGYLKVISSFSPTLPEMLAVEDLATLHLDYVAQERGYRRF